MQGNIDFSKDIVLITGSSKGIGFAIAKAFALAGARVVLNGSKDELALKSAQAQLEAEGLKSYAHLCDVSDYHATEQLFSAIKQHYGDYPTIIINNAGISHVGLFSDTTPDVWQKLMRTNLDSAYNCSHIGLSHMLAKQSGCIINISSIWGNCGASCEVAYSTSKSALNGFTKALAKELGPSHIRVNAIACGWIDTEMNAHFTEEEKAAFTDEVPLCRTGKPEEVANTCLYLASKASSYMTGQILVLDGGLL